MRGKLSATVSSGIQATICFVDLEGFTALTEQHGDEDAAGLATRFAKLTRSVLGPRDHLIKTIGDAVLVTSPDPAAALTWVEKLLTRAPRTRVSRHCAPVSITGQQCSRREMYSAQR